VSIVGSGNAKEGLENIPVKISLDVFLWVLTRLGLWLDK
jgi:hypothetical protein